MGVSKNRGTPKWMVYNGKPYQNGWFGGTPIFGNTHMSLRNSPFGSFKPNHQPFFWPQRDGQKQPLCRPKKSKIQRTWRSNGRMTCFKFPGTASRCQIFLSSCIFIPKKNRSAVEGLHISNLIVDCWWSLLFGKFPSGNLSKTMAKFGRALNCSIDSPSPSYRSTSLQQLPFVIPPKHQPSLPHLLIDTCQFSEAFRSSPKILPSVSDCR